jgi:hypothetical protein
MRRKPPYRTPRKPGWHRMDLQLDAKVAVVTGASKGIRLVVVPGIT